MVANPGDTDGVDEKHDVLWARLIRLSALSGFAVALACVALIIFGRVQDQQAVVQVALTILPIAPVALVFAAAMKWYVALVRAGVHRDVINKKLGFFDGVVALSVGGMFLVLGVAGEATRLQVVLGGTFMVLALRYFIKAARTAPKGTSSEAPEVGPQQRSSP